MSYKQNASANRDALFGGGGSKAASKRSGGPNRSSSKSSASRPAPSTSTAPSTAPAPAPAAAPSRGYSYGAKSSAPTKKLSRPTLSGDDRAAKIKEAEEHRKQAKKCMQRGVFSKPDPVTASMYYKRAADAYQQCGEDRLEKIHRIASADCQVAQGAFATAAAEYTRAAEIVRDSEEPVEEKRKEGCRLHSEAANAFMQMNEKGKAGKSMVQAAMAWTWEDDSNVLANRALVAMEEAVESFVPDPLNRCARFRQTGTSAFANDDSSETPPDLEFAKQHIVTTSYAHEPLLDLVYILIQNREYPSALYSAGAASAILESDGISTLTLGRVYVVETILLLAMGDPVAAEQTFLNVHVQQTSYLTSRECRLAEDLFRAILQRDVDALEETRSPQGPNRGALANLHESVRGLVMQLRISGAARKSVPKAPKPMAVAAPLAAEELVTANPETEAPPPTAPPEEQQHDIDDLHAEMDDLLNDMGLGSDSEEEDLDDDDVDLR